MSRYVIETSTRGGKTEIVAKISGTRKEARELRNIYRRQNQDKVYHERWIGR